MNLDKKREAVLQSKPNNPGWKNKIDNMNGRGITLLYNKMKAQGKLGET